MMQMFMLSMMGGCVKRKRDENKDVEAMILNMTRKLRQTN
jgi:hypothetical protein